MIQCWRLDDSRQSLVLGCTRDRLAEVIYWGARLPDDEDLTTIYESHTLDVTGGMLDANPELSICPEATRTFPGQPGLILRDSDGTPYLPKFCLEKVLPGKCQGWPGPADTRLQRSGGAAYLSGLLYHRSNDTSDLGLGRTESGTSRPPPLACSPGLSRPSAFRRDDRCRRALVRRVSVQSHSLVRRYSVSREPNRAYRA